jgi:hypothetical protein
MCRALARTARDASEPMPRPSGDAKLDTSRECVPLIVRRVLAVGCFVAAASGGAALYLHQDAAPACDSDQAQGQVYRVLHDRFHLESVFLHDFTTLSGGYFGATRDCNAEVAEIKGNVDAADMRWRHIRYHVARSDRPDRPVVTVDLGGATAFVAAPEPTLWSRMFAHF